MQDQVAEYGFENSWCNELDQLSRRPWIAASAPRYLSARHSARANCQIVEAALPSFRQSLTDDWSGPWPADVSKRECQSRREWYPYHFAGFPMSVAKEGDNADSSDLTVAAILNYRPEIHAKQHAKWLAFKERCLKP